MEAQIFKAATRRNYGQNLRGRYTPFLRYAKRKVLSLVAIIQENLTSESRRSCMNNWRSLHRQKVQASINSLKRHFRKRYEMPANNLMQFAPSAPDATWRVQ